MSICAKAKERVSRGWRRWLLAGSTVALIPALYGAGLAIGVPSALACTPQRPGITDVRLLNAEGTRPLAVANDGFFIIAVTGTFGEPAGALTQLSVEVTNAAGEVVSGSLRAVPGYMSWAAASPLADGAYTAKVTVSTPAPGVPQPIEITQALDVRGAPSALSLASIEPSQWNEFHSLTGGTQLSCQVPGNCGPIQFGELEESTPGVWVRVTAPAINGQVYWEARVQPVGGGDAAPLVLFTGEGGATEAIADLRFSQPLAEYCVELKMIDRRTGSELTSPSMCWKPESPTLVDETGVVSSCPQSPSPALLPWWCKNRPNAPACAGVVPPNLGGSAGSAGMAGNSAVSATAGSAGTAGTAAASGTAGTPGTVGIAGFGGSSAGSPPPAGAQADDDASSSACSVGHARGRWSIELGTLLALAALAVRRQRASRSKNARGMVC